MFRSSWLKDDKLLKARLLTVYLNISYYTVYIYIYIYIYRHNVLIGIEKTMWTWSNHVMKLVSMRWMLLYSANMNVADSRVHLTLLLRRLNVIYILIIIIIIIITLIITNTPIFIHRLSQRLLINIPELLHSLPIKSCSHEAYTMQDINKLYMACFYYLHIPEIVPGTAAKNRHR